MHANWFFDNDFVQNDFSVVLKHFSAFTVSDLNRPAEFSPEAAENVTLE